MKSSVKIVAIKPPEPTPSLRLTIDLTRQDAEALLDLCACIGGSPDHSPRHIFDKLSAALYNKKIVRKMKTIKTDQSHAVYFKNYKTL